MDGRDDLLATLAVSRGYCSDQDVREAGLECKRLEAQGSRLQLGQMLLKRNLLGPDEFLALVKAVDRVVFRCPACSRTYRIVKYRAGGSHACRSCGGSLEVFDPTAGPGSATRQDQASEQATDLGARARRANELPESFGEYVVLSLLGRGGMGTVYRARHRQSAREVAIKVLDRVDLPTVRERFVREAKIVERLSHPDIVRIHEFGEERESLYYVMELVEGETLARRLEGGPLAIADALGFAERIARAAAVAHAAWIVHRDLKPANVVLTGSGVKILDFGLARVVDGGVASLTDTGSPIGTPHYMSPEQCRGDKRAIGPATDVFALGVMLYEMLTGKKPHDDRSVTALLVRIQTERPRPPRELRPEIDPALEAICLKALATEPADRYPDGARFAEALECWREAHP